MLFCRLWIFFFFKLNFQKKSFRNTLSVKQFGTRSGPTKCRAWSGSKLFAKDISRRQKLSLAWKELMLEFTRRNLFFSFRTCTVVHSQLSFISTSLISNNGLSRSEKLVPFYHGNLTTGNKILLKRVEIAPKEQFLLFSTIFSIYL